MSSGSQHPALFVTRLHASRKADLQAYIRALDKAVRLVNSGDQEAIQITAKKLSVSPDEAKKNSGVKIFDHGGNKSLGFNPGNPNNVMKNFELNVKAAYDTKLVPKMLDIKSLYDDSIVNSSILRVAIVPQNTRT